MNRFFVSPETLTAAEVELDGPLSRRLRSVLRMRKGDIVVLLDGRGYEYEAVLEDVDGASVRARVRERRQACPSRPSTLCSISR